jgi:hypothetical protein
MSGVKELSIKTNMKTRYFALLTLSTLAVALLTAPNLARAETIKKFEPKQLREDFQIARQSLEEAHPGLYRYTKKTDMDRIFDMTEKSLDHPMDFYEFYRVMALPIAAIKCGHTDVSLSPEVRSGTEQLPWLPFDVKVLESKVYIFRDYAKGGTLAGREIQSINGVPSTSIVCTMLAAESQDGDIQSSRQRVIAQHFGLNLIVLNGLRAPYEVALACSGSNQTQQVQLAGLKHEEMVQMSKKLYPQDEGAKEFAELKFLDGGQIAQLTYSEFGVNVEEGRAFMKRSFEAIQSKGSRALILDLRGNLGGEGELGELLFSYLVGTPFKYYDDCIVNKASGSYGLAKYADDGRKYIIPEGLAELRADGKGHIVTEPLVSLQQPSKPTFTGPVYILINGRSFSTTAEFLTEVHFHHRATFIGEESAGAYYGNNSGDVPRITLPNTKLGLYIPLVSGYMSVEGTHDHEATRGIIPDFPVKRTIGDLLSGVDRDMELALELARKTR